MCRGGGECQKFTEESYVYNPSLGLFCDVEKSYTGVLIWPLVPRSVLTLSLLPVSAQSHSLLYKCEIHHKASCTADCELSEGPLLSVT